MGEMSNPTDPRITYNLLDRRGDSTVLGNYVMGSRQTGQAVCYADRVTSSVLRAMFDEAKRYGLVRPLLVFGRTCTVGEQHGSFSFEQVGAPTVARSWTGMEKS